VADLTQLTGEMIGKNIENNITMLMRLLSQNVDLNVYHHGVIQQLKNGELSLDRIQIMADNQVKVLPPQPAAEKTAGKNGKETTKDVPPLAEEPVEGSPVEAN
jgi:hypothetical protein